MDEWPEAVERVSAVLRAGGVDARIEEFAGGTPTARDAARAVGCELSQIVKSVVLVCDGAYVLALVPGDRRADERSVGAAVSAELVRTARAEEVVHATGFEPGGVAPFPQRAIARTLIDRSLFRHQVVWVGAGTAAHMAALPPGDLQRLTRATAFDLGHAG
jgi:prolyl-tRNA editing enzyme YbaK/EbsC (Cys-tRNA(Pro) deacylase)